MQCLAGTTSSHHPDLTTALLSAVCCLPVKNHADDFPPRASAFNYRFNFSTVKTVTFRIAVAYSAVNHHTFAHSITLSHTHSLSHTLSQTAMPSHTLALSSIRTISFSLSHSEKHSLSHSCKTTHAFIHIILSYTKCHILSSVTLSYCITLNVIPYTIMLPNSLTLTTLPLMLSQAL